MLAGCQPNMARWNLAGSGGGGSISPGCASTQPRKRLGVEVNRPGMSGDSGGFTPAGLRN
jgi:hypothetical protein